MYTVLLLFCTVFLLSSDMVFKSAISSIFLILATSRHRKIYLRLFSCMDMKLVHLWIRRRGRPHVYPLKVHFAHCALKH